MRRDQWDEVCSRVADAARSVQAGGADMVLLRSNTNHQCADAVETAVTLPLVHIVDPTADALQQANIRRVGLLGTRYTMERRFLRDRLEARGLEVIVPGEPDRTTIHDIQFNELVLGKRLDSSRRAFIEVIGRLVDQGADGRDPWVHRVRDAHRCRRTSTPLFNTTVLHAGPAVDLALTE